MVTFGVIWLDYLRRREKAIAVRRLLIFCPARTEREIIFRAAQIDPGRLDCGVAVFDERDRIGPADFHDAGNIDSILPPCRRPVAPNTDGPIFSEMPEVDRVEQSDGAIAFKVRGLEFGRWSPAMAGGRLTCGIGRRRSCGMETLAARGREIARVRSADVEDRQHPLYSQCPEAWLESAVRATRSALDASLLDTPIYGQVPIFCGT